MWRNVIAIHLNCLLFVLLILRAIKYIDVNIYVMLINNSRRKAKSEKKSLSWRRLYMWYKILLIYINFSFDFPNQNHLISLGFSMNMNVYMHWYHMLFTTFASVLCRIYNLSPSRDDAKCLETFFFYLFCNNLSLLVFSCWWFDVGSRPARSSKESPKRPGKSLSQKFCVAPEDSPASTHSTTATTIATAAPITTTITCYITKW